MCGMGSYLSMVGSVSLSGLSEGLGSLSLILPSEIATHSADIKKLISTCVIKEIKNEVIFNLPKNVTFKLGQ